MWLQPSRSGAAGRFTTAVTHGWPTGSESWPWRCRLGTSFMAAAIARCDQKPHDAALPTPNPRIIPPITFMDFFLIIVLGIVVLSIWNSSRDANERMRDAVDRLERELDFLRSQLAALVRANTKSGEPPAQTAPAQPAGAEAVPKAPAPAAAQAAHGATPPIAAFTPIAAPKPVEPVVPAAAPPVCNPTAVDASCSSTSTSSPKAHGSAPAVPAMPPLSLDPPAAKIAEPQNPPARPAEPARAAAANIRAARSCGCGISSGAGCSSQANQNSRQRSPSRSNRRWARTGLTKSALPSW